MPFGGGLVARLREWAGWGETFLEAPFLGPFHARSGPARRWWERELQRRAQRPAAGPPPPPPAAAAASIADLPSDVLGLILTKLVQQNGWRHGTAAAQVCKHWNAVFHSAACSGLWQELDWRFTDTCLIDDAKPAVRLFQRIAPLIQSVAFTAAPTLTLHGRAGNRLPDFLACLRPASLCGLQLAVPLSFDVLQLLPRFARLRKLAIVHKGAAHPRAASELAAALEQLPALQTFEFRSRFVQAPLLAGMCRGISRLDSLTISAPKIQIPGFNQLLTHQFHLDPPADWPEQARQAALLPAVELKIAGCASGHAAVQLCNARLAAGGVLAALLGCVLPAGSRAASLELLLCGVDPASWVGCGTCLAALPSLCLAWCCHSRGYPFLAPAIDALLCHTPLLERLAVDAGQEWGAHMTLPSGPPATLATLRHLTSLTLSGTRLPHLDGVLEGLPGLRELNLQLNCLQQLPVALCCCTQLTRLVLAGNDALVLNEDAMFVLSPLRALVQVDLPATASQAVTDRLARRFPASNLAAAVRACEAAAAKQAAAQRAEAAVQPAGPGLLARLLRGLYWLADPSAAAEYAGAAAAAAGAAE